jgi:hypothetical protein
MNDFRRIWAAYGITRYWYVMFPDFDDVTLRVYRHGGHECLFRVEIGGILMGTNRQELEGAPKWTPGPWRVDQYNQPVTVCGQKIPCFEVDSEIDACWIAKVQDHRNCMGTPEGSANAHLIAAAPELYEALDNMLRIGGPHYDECTARIKKAHAALAKARGES